jgi:hypothetical protein
MSYSRGLQPEGVSITVLKGGRLLLNALTDQERSEQLEDNERRELLAFLESPTCLAAIAALEATGFKPATTDLPEVTLRIQGKLLGYPVCARGPLVAEEISTVAKHINQLGRRHFGSSFETVIPTRTCAPGYSARDL